VGELGRVLVFCGPVPLQVWVVVWYLVLGGANSSVVWVYFDVYGRLGLLCFPGQTPWVGQGTNTSSRTNKGSALSVDVNAAALVRGLGFVLAVLSTLRLGTSVV